jgi:hypothetical protein
MRFAPDHQHRVVQYFLDQLRPSRHPFEEPPQPGIEAAVEGLEGLRVLGPAPAPLGRLKGEHRAQLFLKGTQRHAMRKALSAVLDNRPELKRRVIVDVDPLSVL